jgi:hypothetical protein
MDPEVMTRKSTRQYLENTCNVCHIQFSLGNRSSICSKCFQKTCKLHLTTENRQIICENCLKIELKRQFLQDKQETITNFKNEIRSLQHREKANNKEIKLKSESIVNLEQTLKEQQTAYNLRLKEIESCISQELKQIELSNTQILRLTDQIESSKCTQKSKHETFANTTTELVRIQKDYDSLQAEYDTLKIKANKLKEDNDKMVTFQRIYTITCTRCCQNIILTFKDQIIEILSRKEKRDMIASVLAIKSNQNDNITVSHCKCSLL